MNILHDVNITIFVEAKYGSDKAPGTRHNPVQTLARALELINAIPHNNTIIILGPGNYRMNK